MVYRWSGSDWAEHSSLGAPSGTTVGSSTADVVSAATINFNTRNDRNGAAVTAPTAASDGTAVDHTINTDGSADISFERSEEHTSELQSLMRISSAVFCLKKKIGTLSHKHRDTSNYTT